MKLFADIDDLINHLKQIKSNLGTKEIRLKNSKGILIMDLEDLLEVDYYLEEITFK